MLIWKEREECSKWESNTESSNLRVKVYIFSIIIDNIGVNLHRGAIEAQSESARDWLIMHEHSLNITSSLVLRTTISSLCTVPIYWANDEEKVLVERNLSIACNEKW